MTILLLIDWLIDCIFIIVYFGQNGILVNGVMYLLFDGFIVVICD